MTLCLHPLDTVKVCIQAEIFETRHLPSVLVRFVRERGALRLFSGVGAGIAASAPVSAIYTTSYEAAKAALEPGCPPGREWAAHCASGGLASVATSLVYTPSECVKARVQAGLYRDSPAALAGVLRHEGPLSLYQAWPAVILRNVPQSVVKFFVYEQLKGLARRRSGRSEPRVLEVAVCGGASGAAGALFSTPFDTVKTRMQTQVGPARLGLGATVRGLLAREGLPGLYRGIAPRLAIYLAQGAVFFGSYELLKRALSLGERADSSRPRAWARGRPPGGSGGSGGSGRGTARGRRGGTRARARAKAAAWCSEERKAPQAQGRA